MGVFYIKVDKCVRSLFPFQIRCQRHCLFTEIGSDQYGIHYFFAELRAGFFIRKPVGMMVAQKVHAYIKRTQLLCGTVDAEALAWAKENNMSFLEMLQDIYLKYGFSREEGISVVRPGKTGADEIVAMMKNFRALAPRGITPPTCAPA